MKVILLKDVRGVGRVHEVKNVADGYAANFLFPHKLAEAATDEKVRQMEELQKKSVEAQRKEEEVLIGKIDSLRGKRVTLALRATEKGGLFKAVVAKDIAKAILGEHALHIPEEVIVIDEPIKTVGEHSVHLAAKNKKADITVAVVASVA